MPRRWSVTSRRENMHKQDFMRTSWFSFRVISELGEILFETTRMPRAYHRRVAKGQGGQVRVIHIVELPDKIAFCFEDSGDVLYKQAFEPDSQWFYPIPV